jgi:hypothetical protein
MKPRHEHDAFWETTADHTFTFARVEQSQAGFKETRLHGSLEGTPHDQRAGRLVLLASKAG